MNLQKILKSLKLNESTISMVLGALVIIVIGWLTVNYFKSTDSGTTFPEGTSTELANKELPTSHIVSAGESLWTISEEYYGTGYNWVDIKDANGLASGEISEGDELTIPDVEPKMPEGTQMAEASPTVEPTIEPVSTPEPTLEPTAEPQEEEQVEMEDKDTVVTNEIDNAIEGNSYTVVHGDTLWDISVRAYGTGYKWVDIAAANDLVNPNLIHAGNQFVIPR